jgi:hypothetical protein
MVAVPSVLPLETGMQIEVHYVWPTQFLIDCAVRLKTLAPIPPAAGRRAPPVCRVGPPKAAGPKELRRHDETVPESVPVDVGISAKPWSE